MDQAFFESVEYFLLIYDHKNSNRKIDQKNSYSIIIKLRIRYKTSLFVVSYSTKNVRPVN